MGDGWENLGGGDFQASGEDHNAFQSDAPVDAAAQCVNPLTVCYFNKK